MENKAIPLLHIHVEETNNNVSSTTVHAETPIRSIQWGEEIVKSFSFPLILAGISTKTPRWWKWTSTGFIVTCLIMCISNVIEETRSYRNTLFGIVLVFLHIVVFVTQIVTRSFLRKEEWNEMLKRVSRGQKSDRFVYRIKCLTFIFYTGSLLSIFVIYWGWALPINDSLFHPLEQEWGLPYIFLALHGISLDVLIVPWAWALMGEVCIFNIFTLVTFLEIDETLTEIGIEFIKAHLSSTHRRNTGNISPPPELNLPNNNGSRSSDTDPPSPTSRSTTPPPLPSTATTIPPVTGPLPSVLSMFHLQHDSNRVMTINYSTLDINRIC